MAKQYFERGETGVFKCATCGRSTRRTTQPAGSMICDVCDELAMIENSVIDRVMTVPEIAPERDRLAAEAVARGGSASMLRAQFERLYREDA